MFLILMLLGGIYISDNNCLWFVEFLTEDVGWTIQNHKYYPLKSRQRYVQYCTDVLMLPKSKRSGTLAKENSSNMGFTFQGHLICNLAAFNSVAQQVQRGWYSYTLYAE